MKRFIVIALTVICGLALASCKKEDNPVVQASEYVSEEKSELEEIGDEKENQLAEADALIEELG